MRKNPGLLSALPLAALLLVACGGGPGESTAAGAGTASAAALADACSLLRATDPEAVLGSAHDGGMMLWQRDEGSLAGSQCQFTTTSGDRTLGLMIRRGPGIGAPAGREALIRQTRTENTMGAGEETAQALQAGHEVPGIGDFAVTYEMFSFNLMFWKGNHELIVMLTGFDNVAAEQKARQVAQVLLGRI